MEYQDPPSQSRSVVSRLHEALAVPVPSPDAVAALLSELLSTLSLQAQAIATGQLELEKSLYDDPFPILLLLSPLLRQRTPPEAARQCLDLIALHASPKEVAVGLCERMAELGPPDGDNDEVEDGAIDGIPWEGESAARELVELIRIYSMTLPRIKAVKPSNFLGSAIDAMLRAIRMLRETGAFPDNDELEPSSTVEVMDAVVGFAQSLARERWIDKTREECLDHLRTVLTSAAFWLHHSMSTSMAHDFFHARYPRYRIPGRERKKHTSLQSCWDRLLAVARDVGLEANTLLASFTALSTPSPTHESVVSAIGSLVLLTHLLSSTAVALTPTSLNTTANALLHQSQALLSLATTGDSEQRISDDVVFFWVWWCVEAAREAREALDESIIFTLVEFMSTLAALSPEPETRFLAFRLVSTLIVHHAAGREEIQLMLLKDLIETCPFDQLRVAAIGILRDVLALKFTSPTSSLFLSPVFLRELGPVLLRFQPVDLLDSSTLDVAQFIETHSGATIEKLGMLYFLLVRDDSDWTGIRDYNSITATRQHFLAPLSRRLESWSAAVDASPSDPEALQTRLQLDLLRASLSRVTETLEELERRR